MFVLVLLLTVQIIYEVVTTVLYCLFQLVLVTVVIVLLEIHVSQTDATLASRLMYQHKYAKVCRRLFEKNVLAKIVVQRA